MFPWLNEMREGVKLVLSLRVLDSYQFVSQSLESLARTVQIRLKASER